MRGVSERVGGRAGWAAESNRGVPRFSGRPGTGPASGSPRRSAARRGGSWGLPASPSPTAGRGPGGC